jgi:uncharacterized membrane protein YuzA (DUF378 family)
VIPARAAFHRPARSGTAGGKAIDIAAAVLLVIGGLNWGLIGVFGIDLISAVFGSMSFFSRLIFILVGLAAVYEVFMWRSIQRRWGCELWPRPAQSTGV